MKMKYGNQLFKILNHYRMIEREMEKFKEGERDFLLESWNIYKKDFEDILEEMDAIRYIDALDSMITKEKTLYKPSLEVVNRLFNRHIKFIEDIYQVKNRNSKFDRNGPEAYLNDVVKELNACYHYLFKFSLEAWYEKLPDKILTFEEKYQERESIRKK